MQQETVNVFIAYAREDSEIKERLKKNLTAIFRNNKEDSLWDDGEIHAGEDWKNAIDKALEQADIFLLLLSPDFIASDFCYEQEMRKAIEKHEKEEAIVVPLQIRACIWQNTPLKKLQILPEDGKPIHRSNDQYVLDDLYVQITEKLEEVSNSVKKQKKIRKLHNQFNSILEKAERNFRNENWEEALILYQECLSFYCNNELDLVEKILNVDNNIEECKQNIEFNDLVIHAEFLLEKGEYELVIFTINQANGIKNTEYVEKMKEKANKALLQNAGKVLFEKYLKEADNYFLSMNWEAAELAYRCTLKYHSEGFNPTRKVLEEKQQFCYLNTYPEYFEENGLYGYQNLRGDIIISARFDIAFPFSEGLALVQKGGKWGFIDRKGKVIVSIEYDSAWLFSEGLAQVSKHGEQFYIGKTGERVEK